MPRVKLAGLALLALLVFAGFGAQHLLYRALPQVAGRLRGPGLQAPAEVVRDRSIVATIDASVTGFLREDFLIALPALRQAFSYFPPRERLAIAESVLAIRGHAGHDPMALLRAPVDAELVRRAAALEGAALALARRFGLTDPLDDPEQGVTP